MLTIEEVIKKVSQYKKINISTLDKEFTLDEFQGEIAPGIETRQFLMERVDSVINLEENKTFLKNLPTYKGLKLTILYDYYVGTLASKGKIFGCYQAINIKSPHYWFRKVNHPSIEEISKILKNEIDKNPLKTFLHYMPFQVLEHPYPIYKETLATLPKQVEELEFDKDIMAQHTIVILQQAIVNEKEYYNIIGAEFR